MSASSNSFFRLSRDFDVDVLLKSLFMRAGELSEDICNRFNPEISMKVTISNIPWCVHNTLQHFILVVLNRVVLEVQFIPRLPFNDNLC
jgi:hypothetical protein